MRIIQKNRGGEIDVKRFYIPGTIIQDHCPECKHLNELDLEDQYLSYPKVGEPEGLYFHCDECEHEWQPEIIIEIKVSEA